MFHHGNLRDHLLKLSVTSDNSLTPALSYYGAKTWVKFNGICLKQPKVSWNHGNIVKIYIVYELGASSSHNNDPALKKCLFGAVAYIVKYGYTGYRIGFDKRDQVFHFQVVDLVKIY